MRKLMFFKSKTSLMLTTLFAFLLSCNNQPAEISETNKMQASDTVRVDTCTQKLSADDFTEFIGISYGMNELMLESKLGRFTGGEYTADSSSFIYYFKKIKGAPVTIWVDSQSQLVTTVFMEILGYEELFQSDLNEAINQYNISSCDSRFFGLKYDELKTQLGEPAEEELMKDGVRSVDYDSKDYKCTVNFKFYPDQDNMCSSVSVNWFY